ncbi:class I SAM-dependent methyltransferase [Kitasatospora viridis]|uniref:Methyltransferase family protein n=1 Tax=Kitasatospora viridis TaxID=281105 RepID=A0A561UAA4_9ACTN|nr:methyltransferase [Kitasatospora viridis]TWF96287.1 methyltransferase family protein [Kitasatospora viridis]
MAQPRRGNVGPESGPDTESEGAAQPQHYFSADPAVESARTSIEISARGVTLELQTDVGVFSAGKLDKGTRILLQHVPPPPNRGRYLDLGCGYGPIATTMAATRRRAEVWAVDINNRALELVRDNSARAGLKNVKACRPEEVPQGLEFDFIYSNPPIRIGKAALHELLLKWLPRLTPDGAAFMVVQRNLGSDSLAKWLNEQGFPTERLISREGFRILRTTRPREAVGSDPEASAAPEAPSAPEKTAG